MKNKLGLRGATHLLLWQLGITMVMVAVMAGTLGGKAGTSVLLGGLVCALPNALFARQLFQHHGARAAKTIVNRFYKGEALKLLLSMILFACVFKCATIIPQLFFAAYLVVQMVFWFAPLIFVHKQNRPESD